MSAHIALSATKLTAIRDVRALTLEIVAEGEQNPFLGPAQLKELPSQGFDLYFQLYGAYRGPGPVLKSPPKPVPFTADYKIKFVIPSTIPFRVFVETKDGTKEVPVQFVGTTDSVPQPSAPIVVPPHDIVFLPVISLTIEGPFTNTITAQVPPKKDDTKSSIYIDYNGEFVKVVKTIAEDGTIKWVVAWNKFPVDEGQSPQLIDVTTYTVNTSNKLSRRVIQPYSVSFTNIPPSIITGGKGTAAGASA